MPTILCKKKGVYINSTGQFIKKKKTNEKKIMLTIRFITTTAAVHVLNHFRHFNLWYAVTSDRRKVQCRRLYVTAVKFQGRRAIAKKTAQRHDGWHE